MTWWLKLQLWWMRVSGSGLYHHRALLEQAVDEQLAQVEAVGVSSDFQAGYVCALCHCWDAAGYPKQVSEKPFQMVSEHICGMSTGFADVGPKARECEE